MRAPPEANGTVADTTWHTSFSVPTGHLVFEGHFPQQPIVPGVLLVSLLLDALAEQEVRDLIYYLSRPGQVPMPTGQ